VRSAGCGLGLGEGLTEQRFVLDLFGGWRLYDDLLLYPTSCCLSTSLVTIGISLELSQASVYYFLKQVFVTFLFYYYNHTK
jgi:hypothetical protein